MGTHNVYTLDTRWVSQCLHFGNSLSTCWISNEYSQCHSGYSMSSHTALIPDTQRELTVSITWKHSGYSHCLHSGYSMSSHTTLIPDNSGYSTGTHSVYNLETQRVLTRSYIMDIQRVLSLSPLLILNEYSHCLHYGYSTSTLIVSIMDTQRVLSLYPLWILN